MKRFLFLLLLGTTLATTLHAQSTDSSAYDQPQSGQRAQASPEQRTTRQLTALTKKLTLTPDQVTQLRPILLNENMTLDSLRTHPSGKRRAAMSSRRDAMQDTDGKINAILTDEQKPLYQQWKDEQKQRLIRMRTNRQPANQ